MKDLEEVESAASCEGIATWRAVLAAEGSGDGCGGGGGGLDKSLLDRFTAEPESRFLLTGNQKRMVTPCKLPPSRASVVRWLEEKRKAVANGRIVPRGNGGKVGAKMQTDSDLGSSDEDDNSGSMNSTLLATAELVDGDSTITELLFGSGRFEKKKLGASGKRSNSTESNRSSTSSHLDSSGNSNPCKGSSLLESVGKDGQGGGNKGRQRGGDINQKKKTGSEVMKLGTEHLSSEKVADKAVPGDGSGGEIARQMLSSVGDSEKGKDTRVTVEKRGSQDGDSSRVGSKSSSTASGQSQTVPEIRRTSTPTDQEMDSHSGDMADSSPTSSQGSVEVVWMTRTLTRGESGGHGSSGSLVVSPGHSPPKSGPPSSRWDQKEHFASPPSKRRRLVISPEKQDRHLQGSTPPGKDQDDLRSGCGGAKTPDSLDGISCIPCTPEEQGEEGESEADSVKTSTKSSQQLGSKESSGVPLRDQAAEKMEREGENSCGSVTPPPPTGDNDRDDEERGGGEMVGGSPGNQSHSTPVRGRGSADLFPPAVAPIASAEKDAARFAAPRSVGPGKKRRLSGATETSLRRVLAPMQEQLGGAGPSKADTSQIEGPTPKNPFGFKVSQQNAQDSKALHEHQYLTVMTMELHAETRGDLYPDPEQDAIFCIFYCVLNDAPASKGPRRTTGAIIVDPPSCGGGGPSLLHKSGVELQEVTYVRDEAQLLDALVELILRYDPDILVGFEIQRTSWGYALHRASHLSVPLCSKISRVPAARGSNRHSALQDEWGAAYSSEIHVAGRIVLNLWRILRHEVTLNIYSYENVAFHVLHKRVPAYSFRSLTAWFQHRTHLLRWRVVEHYRGRVEGELDLMDQLDLIGKTSEFARVFGIEFFDVLSRGSQYRVESMMLRLAKPLNYIAVSPNVHQRARQRAPECIPLTLEPESRVYTDPVVVLDFQSLYPSIMIAYNYCFSTCLGRLDSLAQAHEGPIEFGCTTLSLSPATIKKLEKDVTISPNGVVFAKQHVRKGVISQMVEEILKTRIMVKKMMKEYKGDRSLYRMLDARQLGLKLIANVTYGYTGANFSGRMPCVEVADSIVRKARETLERAIQLVHDTPRWDARVVYGDTDSMFILLKGRSRAEAFVTGQEIADAVTDMFPRPMKLKFEKVYLPCVLQTKKRYAGFMYETPDQQEPVFDAKGIETVRRDNCGAVSKVLERSIKLLFTTLDVSRVREYVERQCSKLLAGRVSLQDCIFAKEFRGLSGYKPGACVPALEIARKLVQHDRNAEPRVGERIPYVVVYGPPGLPLIQLVRSPGEVLADPSLRINAVYYVTKQVLPPLHRMLSLLGVDVFAWYNEMPKVHRIVPPSLLGQEPKKGTISHYFGTSDCLVCETQTKQPVCPACLRNPQLTSAVLTSRIHHWDRTLHHLAQVCYSCMGVQDPSQPCSSLDCPVMFRRKVAAHDASRGENLRSTLDKVLSF